MTNAVTSATRLSYIAESTENVIPTSPGWQNLRFTSETLNYNKVTVQSDEIRPDRNVSDLIDVGYGSGGNFGFELSYGTLDALLESLFFSTWSSNIIKNGVTPKTFAFEKTFETGAADRYMRFAGCQLGSMSLSIRAREKIQGEISVLGRDHTYASAILSGATYADANTKAIMTASNDVGSLTFGSFSPAADIMAININIDNNLREQIAVASRGAIGIGSGRFVVTGSVEAYFSDMGMYAAFVDHDDVQIQFTVGSVSTEKYTFNLPKTKLSNGTVQTPGNDQDVFANFDFQALYDVSGSPANNSSIVLTRAVV